MAEERKNPPDGQNQEFRTHGLEERGTGTPAPEHTTDTLEQQISSPDQQTVSVEQQLEEEKKKAEEYLDSWRRSAAEFANYKKRVEKEKTEYAQFASSLLLAKLLDVMDGFDAAFNSIPERFREEPWVEGIRLVEQKLKRVLESEGVKPIEAQGKEFDPNYHDAMFYEQSPGVPEGRVIGEFQRGYMLGDRVLRPTRVKVSKGEG